MFVKANFDDVFSRTVLTDLTVYLRYSDVEDEYSRELLSFRSGENILQGYLYGAENTKGVVVICHGLGGGAEDYLAETLYFVDNGYRVFSYDNTGCYRSEGSNCIGLPQSVIDLDAALTYIEQEPRFNGLPLLLYGHSWGGYAVAAIFGYDHNIKRFRLQQAL
ncbi:MAG: lysophospholipase [Bacteroides sp.]|nr:lysophospholipase [Bacteroides sp.]